MRLPYNSVASIRGNSGTGLPTTCPSGNLPHSASAKTKVPRLNSIRPSQLANAIGETLHKLRRVYQRIPVELAIYQSYDRRCDSHQHATDRNLPTHPEAV